MATKDRHFIHIVDREKNRDRITVEVPKGKREIYKQAAHELNLSLSRLVQISIEEFLMNHGSEVLSTVARAQQKQ